MRRTLTEYCLKNSIMLASFAMWEFSRLNRNKIAQCERENITEDKAGEYVDMGDASPLYRCIPFLVSSLVQRTDAHCAPAGTRFEMYFVPFLYYYFDNRL